MKITFDGNSTNQNVDRVMTTTYRETRPGKTAQAGGYALDISGTVMDNKAYKGQGKTTEDVMREAGLIDTATQKDYMTVMSNSMSAEDFKEMMKDGYHPGYMDVEEVITIVDKIKAELAKGGTQVEGYTDRIDEETLEKIIGSEAFARELCRQFDAHDVPVTEENVRETKKAYDKAASLEELSEGAVKYMVENRMAPTIDNLYLAEHSSTADGDRQGKGYYADGIPGYYSRKAEDYNWQQLRPQMEKVIEEAGLADDEEMLAEARWLVEKGIPLTPEAVKELHALQDLRLPQDTEKILRAAAAAIADGKEAGKADLSDGRSNLEKAAEYAERFEQISEQAVDKTVAEGKEMTLRNLEQAQEQIEEGDISGRDAKERPETVLPEVPENITARRQLEEVRLVMTIEANRKLLESGYAIDTTELEQLVEALKAIEAKQQQLLFGEEDVDKAAAQALVYTETRNRTTEIPYMPIDVVGKFRAKDEDFTLNQVHIEGNALKKEYEDARQKYETLMTSPRADMGDSIRKAFRNVDDILEDLELDVSEENRRAVRILGYNRMEVTKENIQEVKASDLELRRVIGKMTPAATLQAIRDGKNPLEMTVSQLNDYLDSTQYEKEQDEEKYSRFLYRLEQNQEISQEERDAYIGIYRMFRQFEKTDDAAVGTLVNAGAELSFRNLLSAVRSNKKHGMDFTVDDMFGGLDFVRKNESISEQIENGFGRYYRQLAGEMADRMAGGNPETGDLEAEREYLEEQLQEYRQIKDVEDDVINELLNNKQPLTPNHLAAADMLINQRGFLYRKLKEFTKPADKDRVKDAVSHLHESLTDKDSARKAYGGMQQTLEELLDEAQYDAGIQYIDLKAIQSCRKQLTLAGNLAQEENYQIPVEINGETTAIHLKILHGGEEGGKVKATLSTEAYGNVGAEFSVRNRKVSGYIACSTADGTAKLQEKEEELQKALQKGIGSQAKEMELGDIGIIHSRELDLHSFSTEEASDGKEVQSADLYHIAKAFITVITA